MTEKGQLFICAEDLTWKKMFLLIALPITLTLSVWALMMITENYLRYLFAPGEYEGGDRRRATDPVWSLEIFELSHSKVSPDQPVMYYLSGGPKRSFVREELQVVPEDTEAPPKSVK